MKSDGEINQAAPLKSIDEIVKSLDIKIDDLNFYGPYQAKLKPSFIKTLKEHKTAKLILVTAMSPTPLLAKEKQPPRLAWPMHFFQSVKNQSRVFVSLL